MASVSDLTHQSGFIFEAQLEQLGASTASGYSPTAETAIVRVTRIVKSTPALSGYAGQRITVQLQNPVSMTVGQQAVFFTHGIHYGDGLVVTELGSATSGAPAAGAQALAQTSPDLDTDISNALQASQDTAMTQRLSQAQLVVTGVASAPRPYSGPPAAAAAPIRRISEHEPNWWTSTITVDTVEKGVHSAKTADIIFPNSIDIAWYRSPKVKEGDQGVWLLHNLDMYGKRVPALAVTHPLDFQPAGEVNRVRSLLK